MLTAVKYTSVLGLATAKLLGRSTAGTGAAEALSVGAGLSLAAGTLSAAVQSVAGRTGAVTLAPADIGIISTQYGGTGVDNSTGGTANQFWARPNGATGAAAYRAIVAADIPTLNQNTSGSSASCTGNAATATTLLTARLINGVSFNGSADVTVTAAAGTLTGTTLAAGVVNSSLTSLGIIGAGTWQGTKVGLAYGGTNLDMSATGGASKVLKQTTAGGAITVAQVTDADLSVSDVTTNNVSITAHGFAPKAPNDATKYLDGTGAYSVPAGSGGTAANPTASVGLSAVNGVASTYMRSDAAPALSQSISPTWSGTHTFSNDIAGAGAAWTSKFTKYNNITTAGFGAPCIVASGRQTSQTSTIANVFSQYTVGGSDASYRISANVLISAYTAGSIAVTLAWTDEASNARTLTLAFTRVSSGAISAPGAPGALANFVGLPNHIRAKAATTITCAVTNSGWTGTYNVEAILEQIA